MVRGDGALGRRPPHAGVRGGALGDRVRAVVSVSGLAPFGASGLDWFAGMSAGSEASLRAAVAGRAAKEAYEANESSEASDASDASDAGFVPADLEALDGPWRWFEEVVRPALADGPGPVVDDDLAYVQPWGFEPHDVAVPTVIVHGRLDRMVPFAHGEWLAAACPSAELLASDDGHLSVLRHAEHALDWLVTTTTPSTAP